MVPRLIRVIREATVAARDGNVPDDDTHFFALFLLSEFQAAEALPAILEAVSLPGELPFDLFDDAVTSILARLLAQFAGDSLELLDALIADRGVNEYVRWEAAHAYIYLVRDGRMPRGTAVQRLQRHLRQAIDQEDITEAYDRGLADPFVMSREDVDESIAEGDARVQRSLARCSPTPIVDTIEELRHWAAFQEEPVVAPVNRAVPQIHSFLTARDSEPVLAPVIPDRPRIGRNDACPCGSGKKFKKCCGSRQ